MTAGRPAFEITEEVCKKAESLAAQGLAEYQIAAVLGISQETLIQKKKGYSEFSEAIATGKAKGIAQITNAVFQKAKSGDVQAAKYYLNNRDNANWNERRDINVGGQEGNPLNIKLAAREMTPEEAIAQYNEFMQGK